MEPGRGGGGSLDKLGAMTERGGPGPRGRSQSQQAGEEAAIQGTIAGIAPGGSKLC